MRNVNRIDGYQKVRGEARYAADRVFPEMVYAEMVGSTVASGRILRIDTAGAEASPGSLLILTHENRGHLGKLPQGKYGATTEPRPPLENTRIHYYGQFVAMVVAETFEQARHAASRLRVLYEPAEFAVTLDGSLDGLGQLRVERCYPDQCLDEDLQVQRGDVEEALGRSEIRLKATYRTPNEHPCAMEPHATVALWSESNSKLTVYNSTQWVLGDRRVLAEAFELPWENVQVLAPFVGGMFGSKFATGPHTILAALASKRLGRPVKAVLTRQQVLTNVGHRTETVQSLELGALSDGTLMAIRHETQTHAAVVETHDPDEFHEPTSLTTRQLYSCPNFKASHEAIRLNVAKPRWMRAPGESTGQWALESAIDELAYALKMDPLELRRKNHTDIHPQRRKFYSSKHLLECYDRGAKKFGWEQRNPRPGQTRDGDLLVGWGTATATYSATAWGATVRVRLLRDDGAVRATVSTAGVDVGMGMYTMLALTAAEALGLPVENVSVELGDSDLPYCSCAAGSNLTASTAPGVQEACHKIRQKLLSGRTVRTIRANTTTAELFLRSKLHAVASEATTKALDMENDRYCFQSFGAHFVEVQVRPQIGQIRVSRVVSVFDVGRVLNPKGARSQFIGGIVFGIGAALVEELTYDPASGLLASSDLASYLIPVSADVPEIDVSWIDKPDLNFNSQGCRGLGEIGITGMAAAVANAVFHATGVRIRELPITPEKIADLKP